MLSPRAIAVWVAAALVLSGCIGGTDSSTPAPLIQVHSVSPISGSTAGGTTLTIMGKDFQEGATVHLGAIPCATVLFIFSSRLQCTTPALTPATLDSTVDVVVTNPNAEKATLPLGFSYIAPEISDWTFVDADSDNGLNHDPNQGTELPNLAVLNGKLWAIWTESDGAHTQVRVARFNGDTSTPQWAFLDGDGISGINRNAMHDASNASLIVLQSEIYAVWQESNPVSQIRVAHFAGTISSPSWTFVDGNGVDGLNKDAARAATGVKAIIFNSQLYLTWSEPNATAAQIRVALYNGNDNAPAWSFADGNGNSGINKEPLHDATDPHAAVADSKLYIAWQEQDGGSIIHVRAAVFGNDALPDWTIVDGGNKGLNRDTAHNADSVRLVEFNDRLYATWRENSQIRVAIYDGHDTAPDWGFIDGNAANVGINRDSAAFASLPIPLFFNSKLHISWLEEDASMINQVRVAVYQKVNSTDTWTFVDGNNDAGLNKNSTLGAAATAMTVLGANPFIAWSEKFAGASKRIHVKFGQ